MSRHTATIDVDATDDFTRALTRARAAYLEMPGLKLTAPQATRLLAIDLALCRTVLSTLVQTRFLVQTSDAAFTRGD